MSTNFWKKIEKKFNTKLDTLEKRKLWCKINNFKFSTVEKDYKDSYKPTFRQKIYSALLAVPKGKVTTYKELAQRTKSKAYRAVGTCMNKNPYAPKVPCHRVISADGSLGGFATGIKNKVKLLKAEEVKIKGSKIDEKYFYKHK